MTRTGAKKKEYAYGVGPSSNTLSFMTKHILPLSSITWPPAQFEDYHLLSHGLRSVLLSVLACEQKIHIIGRYILALVATCLASLARVPAGGSRDGTLCVEVRKPHKLADFVCFAQLKL